MKKTVVILLIFAFLISFGLLYDDDGNWQGLRTTTEKTLDVLMWIPDRVANLSTDILGTDFIINQAQDVPGWENLEYDMRLRFKVDDKYHTSYLKFVSCERRKIVRPPAGLGMVFQNDIFKFEIVANSFNQAFNTHQIEIQGGGWKVLPNFKKICTTEAMFPDGNWYTIDTNAELPYHLLEEE